MLTFTGTPLMFNSTFTKLLTATNNGAATCTLTNTTPWKMSASLSVKLLRKQWAIKKVFVDTDMLMCR